MKVLIVFVAAVAACSAQYGHGHYSGPLASPVVHPNGFLADTPEVAAAKAAHLGEHAKAGSPAPAYNHYAAAPAPAAPAYNQYASVPAPAAPAYNHYAPAAPAVHYNGASVTPQGFLADTPEIAAAKAAHFAEVAKTKTNPSYGPEAYDDGSYRPEYDNPNYGQAPAAPAPYAAAPAPSHYASAPSHYASAPSHYAPAPAHGASHYSGPLAAPVVTPQGFLAETPEVAAAKAAHFAEFSKAGSAPAHHYRRRRSAVLVQTPASTTPLTAVAPVAYSAAPVAYAPAPVAYSAAPVAYAPAPVAYASAPVAHYAHPYAYSHPYRPLSGFSYSVSSW